jgi:hypothetical protein
LSRRPDRFHRCVGGAYVQTTCGVRMGVFWAYMTWSSPRARRRAEPPGPLDLDATERRHPDRPRIALRSPTLLACRPLTSRKVRHRRRLTSGAGRRSAGVPADLVKPFFTLGQRAARECSDTAGPQSPGSRVLIRARTLRGSATLPTPWTPAPLRQPLGTSTAAPRTIRFPTPKVSTPPAAMRVQGISSVAHRHHQLWRPYRPHLLKPAVSPLRSWRRPMA